MTRSMVALAERGLELVTPRRLAVAVACALLVVGVPGILDATGIIKDNVFDLNGEDDFPALVSSAVLVFAAASALAYALVRGRGEPGRRAAFLLTVLFAYMALDEFGQIHERLEHITGVDWQTLYLPFFALAGITALVLLRSWKGSRALRVVLVIGGLAWASSQVFELFEYNANDVRVRLYELYVVIEELLEMSGSFLLAAAFVLAGRRVLSERRGSERMARANAAAARTVPQAVAVPPVRHATPSASTRNDVQIP